MGEREALARLLEQHPAYSTGNDQQDWFKALEAADAIIAVGWIPGDRPCPVHDWQEARAERDALAATVQRVRDLCAPRRCHQCDGTGQQEAGERHPGPRLVQSAPTTETCHLCSGAGAVEPLAVTVDDLRATLAPSDPATDTGGEGQ